MNSGRWVDQARRTASFCIVTPTDSSVIPGEGPEILLKYWKRAVETKKPGFHPRSASALINQKSVLRNGRTPRRP